MMRFILACSLMALAACTQQQVIDNMGASAGELCKSMRNCTVNDTHSTSP